MTIEAKAWDGTDLTGKYSASYKIDGIQLVVENGSCMSRKGKPLYNLPPGLADGIYEVFCGDWSKSMSACRTKKGGSQIKKRDLYKLFPIVDKRLRIGLLIDPTAAEIRDLATDAVYQGYEGIMLRKGNELLKVKEKHTLDVRVIGWEEGTKRNKGRLGALITDKGKVGTGFSDRDREQHLKLFPKGCIIEVECMKITPAGVMREARYIRRRSDKE